jgi:transcription-repair coupling factor (superfamily II helicase)
MVSNVTLNHVLPGLALEPDIRELIELARESRPHAAVVDLPASLRPALVALLSAEIGRPLLGLTSRADRADLLAAAINEFLPTDRNATLWQAPEALPFEQLPFDLQASAERVSALATLMDPSVQSQVVVTPAHGLMHLVTPPDELQKYSINLAPGSRLSIDTLMQFAARIGFQTVPLVQEPGQIAKRGGIIDIWPSMADLPARVDFFGDEVDSIRRFQPGSQRSDQVLKQLRLLPATELPFWRLPQAATAIRKLDSSTLRPEVEAEWFNLLARMEAGVAPASIDLFSPYLVPSPATLLDYLPANTLVVVDEPAAVRLAFSNLEQQATELQAGFEANGELPVGLKRPFATWSDLEPSLNRSGTIALGLEAETTDRSVVSLAAAGEAPYFAGRVARMASEIGSMLSDGWSVVIASDQVERLSELFTEQGLPVRTTLKHDRGAAERLTPGVVDIRPAEIDGGWTLPAGRIALLTDLELFGFRKAARHSSRRSLTESISFASSLTPGEYVVHIDHGIAKFTGLIRAETGGVEREYLLLEYQKGDKLYVPVDQSHRVTRYSGGGIDPQVTKLGSGEWIRTRQRVRRAVREMAFELVQLYAAREAGHGYAFPADTTWDRDLEESFPFTETVDQLRAINEVRADLESNQPMDRLVCGDVGFGKTEVALRAAFKVVNGGKQVAILVPTTVLALQHYESFRQRLAAFPVKIEMLSRLRSKREQKVILERLADGEVDIVIGTHRLVQNDVKFKDLGLVVIDEEQRFGVRHKEFLKQLRTEVDVMTMSATPIPRTLHMSLAGIRDISIINTAPQARLPIRTFVTDSSDPLLREVILRELDRGGQVFVVHNRVQSIDKLATHLRHLVPEATFGVGHGQMDEEVLEQIILSFIRKEFDVLIATTIIESGVDIANVNTIIIDNADTLGLTQLYQLRGRVGRSTRRAYAYLLHRPKKPLSLEAQERLEAIQEATELGAGMQVAMRDMEIRGAGNILGAEQSGHIGAIGYDLYIRLLAQAVEEIKQGAPIADKQIVTLDLPLTALIPEDYVSDAELRLATYRRVADVASLAELEDMRSELADRFGAVPDEVEHLFALIQVRLRCETLGIESVVEREREIVLRPVETRLLDRGRLERELGSAIRFTPNLVRIRVVDLRRPWQQALDLVLDAIESAAARGDRTAAATPTSARVVR